MKRLSLALLLAAASVAVLSAQATPDQETIRDLRTASNSAIAASNAARFAESLDKDFVVVTGNGSFLTRENYVAAFARDFEDAHSVRFERIVDSIDISRSVPLAAEHGHWVGRIPGGPVIFSGSYLAMWRKGDAGWKLRSELFVSLDCKDAAACESYRHRYGSAPGTPAK
jgi:ketosteroid isomerase-like protein